MTDDQRLIVEMEYIKENLNKLEKKVEEFPQINNRYLDALNRVLEAQSENRTSDKQIFQDIAILKEKILIMDSSVNQLHNIDAYTEIKRFIEHAKNEKEVDVFMKNTADFMSSTHTSIKILFGTAGAIVTVLIGLLFAIITKMLGG